MKPEGKFLWRPLNAWRVNQYFGENKACISLDGSEKYIYCDGWNPPEGYRSIYLNEVGHTGIDLMAGKWTPCHAAQTGTVYFIDRNMKSGYDVRIKSRIGNFTFFHLYEHLEAWNVKEGDVVETGQLIGWTGNTGYSTGPHLHWQCTYEDGTPFDPLPHTYNEPATKVLKLNNSIKALKESVEKLKVGILGYSTAKYNSIDKK